MSNFSGLLPKSMSFTRSLWQGNSFILECIEHLDVKVLSSLDNRVVYSKTIKKHVIPNWIGNSDFDYNKTNLKTRLSLQK